MTQRIKLLLNSDSGGGKTSALAHLLNSGFYVRVLDFDNNTRIIRKYLKSPDLWDSYLGIHSFNTVDDDLAQGKSRVPAQILSQLSGGFITNEGKNLGKITEWGTDTVLAVDTGTFMGKMFMRDALLRYRSKDFPKGYNPDGVGVFDRSVYGMAQTKFDTIVKHLCLDPSVKCNVVFNVHPKFTEEEGTNITKCYPDTGVGSALSPKLGGNFTDVWRIDTKNDGSKSFRIEGDARTPLKNSFPFVTKTDYEFDLGKAFKELLS